MGFRSKVKKRLKTFINIGRKEKGKERLLNHINLTNESRQEAIPNDTIENSKINISQDTYDFLLSVKDQLDKEENIPELVNNTSSKKGKEPEVQISQDTYDFLLSVKDVLDKEKNNQENGDETIDYSTPYNTNQYSKNINIESVTKINNKKSKLEHNSKKENSKFTRNNKTEQTKNSQNIKRGVKKSSTQNNNMSASKQNKTYKKTKPLVDINPFELKPSHFSNKKMERKLKEEYANNNPSNFLVKGDIEFNVRRNYMTNKSNSTKMSNFNSGQKHTFK